MARFLCISILFAFLIKESVQLWQQPSDCFTSTSNFTTFIQCMFTFLVPTDSVSSTTTVPSIVPTYAQSQVFQQVVIAMLQMGDQNCSSIALPAAVTAVNYKIQVYSEVVSPTYTAEYCVLYETALDQVSKSRFLRGWGMFIVFNTKVSVQRQQVHLSAAHPWTDGPVQYQAAYMFKAIGAGSLLLSTSRRNASLLLGSCMQSGGDGAYYETDDANQNTTMFHAMAVAVSSYQQSLTCPSATCVFMQFHGKGNSTCPDVSMYPSSGISSNFASYYNNCNLPSRRLQNALKTANPCWNPLTPGDKYTGGICPLSGDQNPWGRQINGVSANAVCSRGSNGTNVPGQFLHCEQAYYASVPAAYPYWVQALTSTFGTSCAPGYTVKNSLCTSSSGKSQPLPLNIVPSPLPCNPAPPAFNTICSSPSG